MNGTQLVKISSSKAKTKSLSRPNNAEKDGSIISANKLIKTNGHIKKIL